MKGSEVRMDGSENSVDCFFFGQEGQRLKWVLLDVGQDGGGKDERYGRDKTGSRGRTIERSTTLKEK